VRPEITGFPEYGFGGDVAGARRSRRSFRLCLAACVVFTGTLWFAENFLRYEHTERLYRSALTLEPESARVLLKSAVKTDKEVHKTQTPKYVAALAEREEDDTALATYEEAYKLDPNNVPLAIRYGSRLFLAGRHGDAYARFHEAAERAPQNALPRYLEAAALLWASEDKDALSKSLALAARTNTGEQPLTFPEPLWFSTLPQDGAWYVRLRRQIADEVCAPLYQYAWRVFGAAEPAIEQDQVHSWDSWLETLQAMGRRVASDSTPGAIQTTAGIRIQTEAIALRMKISEAERGAPDAALMEQRLKLKSALELVNGFEAAREERMAGDRAKYRFPLVELCLKPGAAMFLLYLAMYALSRILHGGWSARTLRHPFLEKAVLLAGGLVVFVLLHTVTVLQHTAGPGGEWMTALTRLTWFVVACLAVFGLVHPAAQLPRAEAVARRSAPPPEELPAVVRMARKVRRRAYVTLVRRYYGILLAMLIMVFCSWVVTYRIAVSLYPWQVNLLTTGLAEEEMVVVQQALAMTMQ